MELPQLNRIDASSGRLAVEKASPIQAQALGGPPMGRSPARGRKDQRSNGPQQPKAKRQAKGPKFLRGLTPPLSPNNYLVGHRPPLDHWTIARWHCLWTVGRSALNLSAAK